MTQSSSTPHLHVGLMFAVALTTLIDMASNMQRTTGIGSATAWHWASLVLMFIGVLLHRSGWLIVGIGGVAVLSATWQFFGSFVSPSVYLLSPPNLLWVMIISWWMWQHAPATNTTASTSFNNPIALMPRMLPFVLIITLFVGYSPLTAVYADTYGGGDTLVGQGVSGLLFFGVCWGGVHAWLRQQHWPAWSFALLSGMVALAQAALRGEWYLCAAFFISTVIADGIVSRWPAAQRMVVALWPTLFCAGYFFTLRSTSLLAWNPTVWGGVVVFALGIGYALVSITPTPHINEKGTTA
jgi:hypothetical protein